MESSPSALAFQAPDSQTPVGAPGTSPSNPSGSHPPSARWERPAKYALLLGALVAYLWNLGANGWANSFYSAAVQAGSVNWEAFLFGSSDASNSITVDKPPASLWPMELSVRIFGLNSWAILVPEVLMAVGTVWLLYSSVRRYFGPAAGLLAGSVMAVTPVAALMFRFNNPDALLVLLLTAATVLTLRAIESSRVRWLVWAGVAVGFAFLTKQLQAFLVLPALVAVYAYAGPGSFLRRVRHLLAAFAAMVVSAGWWVAIVELTPAGSRPYIGGSQHNSFWELTFGYNGFGRLTGNETGSVTPGGGGGGGTSMWGSTGIFRMFESEVGGQISWLLPTALILLIVGVAARGRLPRTDIRRASLLAFGGTLVVSVLAFSFMAGIFHAYYTVALAPFIAVVVAAGATSLWERRDSYLARGVMAATIAVTAIWSWVLLDRSSAWMPWVRVVVAILAIGAIGALLAPSASGIVNRRRVALAAALATGAGLLGPAAYAVDTIATSHAGSIPSAGPSVAGGFGGPGGQRGFGGIRPNGQAGFPGGRLGAPPGGAPGAGAFPGGFPGGPGGTAGGGFARRGGVGGSLLNSSTVGSALKALLEADGSKYTWVAAAIGSNQASGYQLATRLPVMPIGGFNGSDPFPSLAQFQQYVTEGKIHYFIGGGVGGGPGGQANGGSRVSTQIASWVAAHFTAKTVDGVTIYDLTAPTS